MASAAGGTIHRLNCGVAMIRPFDRRDADSALTVAVTWSPVWGCVSDMARIVLRRIAERQNGRISCRSGIARPSILRFCHREILPFCNPAILQFSIYTVGPWPKHPHSI